MGNTGDALAQAAGSTYFINVDSTYSGDFDAVLSFTGTPTPFLGIFYTASGITSLVADDLSIGAGSYSEFGIALGPITYSQVDAPIIVGDGYTGSYSATQFSIGAFYATISGEGSGSVGDQFTFSSY